MNLQSSNPTVKARIAEIREYAQRHGKTPAEVVHMFLSSGKPGTVKDSETENSVDWGKIKEATPDQRKSLAIALEMVLQGARVASEVHTTLYRNGYIDKPIKGVWGITSRGKKLIGRFKILTNSLGEVIGENVRVAKKGVARR